MNVYFRDTRILQLNLQCNLSIPAKSIRRTTISSVLSRLFFCRPIPIPCFREFAGQTLGFRSTLDGRLFCQIWTLGPWGFEQRSERPLSRISRSRVGLWRIRRILLRWDIFESPTKYKINIIIIISLSICHLNLVAYFDGDFMFEPGVEVFNNNPGLVGFSAQLGRWICSFKF